MPRVIRPLRAGHEAALRRGHRASFAIGHPALAAAGSVFALAVIFGGCTELLDMPEPRLCDGVCADSSAPVPDQDASISPPIDQASPPDDTTLGESGSPAPDGQFWDDARSPAPIRCGDDEAGTNEAGTTLDCIPPEVCCRMDSSGVIQYACTSADMCPRLTTTPPATYPIDCTEPANCNAGYRCCHFRHATNCIPESAEGGLGHCDPLSPHYGDVVCDPAVPASCPMGSCAYPLSDIGALGCWAPP